MNRRWTIRIAVGIGLSLAACGSSGTTSTTSSTASGAVATSTSSSNSTTSTTAPKIPGIGDSVNLTDETVTLVGVIDPATSDQGLGVPTGDRLVAVNIAIRNTSTSAFEPVPILDSVLVDAAGHSYSATVDPTTSCQGFSGSLSLNAGDSASGCEVFAVPTGDAPAKFQYNPKDDTLTAGWVINS